MASGLRMSAAATPFTENEILGLRSVVPTGGTCFDIGAAYGMYTFPLAHLVGKTGSVHSFEPLTGSYRLLALTKRLVGGKNIQLHRSAVGRESGWQPLTVPRQWGFPIRGRAFLAQDATSLGPNERFTSHQEVGVPVTTVDETCRNAGVGQVDFLKIDVEGAELAVLEGASETIAAHSPALLLEIEDRHVGKYGLRATDLVDYLTSRGYRMYVWKNREWTETDRVTVAVRNYLFSVALDRSRSKIPALAGQWAG
ncbi:FkbM family methyltransferase [Fodinicola feengrottensis]|uniref:FkbM family methyltransferase n=1 Tax=Fodinicola feengrottensis TaxID=435914 RepID=A0ABN2G5T6_9ACTN